MLSRKNYNKLNEYGLYKRPPTDKDRERYHDVYWCKNWTFRCNKHKDGTAVMVDTYWGDGDGGGREVTDENIDEFKFIFDFRDVEKIRPGVADEYREEDVYHVSTDSGGMYCGGNYYVKVDAKPSIDLQIEKAEAEFENALFCVGMKKNTLARLYEKKGEGK